MAPRKEPEPHRNLVPDPPCEAEGGCPWLAYCRKSGEECEAFRQYVTRAEFDPMDRGTELRLRVFYPSLNLSR